MYILGLRRLGDDARVRVCTSLDQLAFSLVPGREDFCRGRAAQDARVDETSEADAGDVARGTEDAFKIPNSFCAD